MRPIHAFLPILFVAVAGSSLGASDVRFGVQGALAFPTGDLKDVSNPGLQVGGHARWDFGSGHGLMGRADVAFYGSKDGVTSRAIGGGADYTYHVDRNRRGLYLLAGVSFQDYNLDNSYANRSYTGLGVDLGVGYDVDRNLGFQARVTRHNLDLATFSSVNFGVTYTF